MDLAQVIGANCKHFRAGASMEDLAEHARKFGVRWNSGTIAKIEAGTHKTTVVSLVALAAALESLNEYPIFVPDLISSSESIQLNDSVSVADGSVLAAILSGAGNLQSSWEEAISRRAMDSRTAFSTLRDPADIPGWPQGVSLIEAADIHAAFELADFRIAGSLGIIPPMFAAWCFRLWRKTFVSERDSRAGVAANAQKRGRVTRELKAEIQGAMSSGD